MADQLPPWDSPAGRAKASVLHMNNSLTLKKEPFLPVNGSRVKWYICGPTVYDSSHIGHARNYMTFDIIKRILEGYFGYHVEYIMNITDVDDKIILKARRNFLLEEYRKSHTVFTAAVKKDLEEAVEKHRESLKGKIEKLKVGGNEAEVALMEKKVVQLAIDEQAISTGVEGEPWAALFTTLADPLAVVLDGRDGKSVTDQAIFRRHAEIYEREFLEDLTNLGVGLPDVLTRVTEYVPEIIAMVAKIVENGFGYVVNGSVYFDTLAFDGDAKHNYCKLEPWSRGDLSLLADGEGALAATGEKQRPNDFALWKQSKDGEPSWDSPWGKGRPGWHIECSAMASSILGEQMDIHSGGSDLKFPHHDNEMAQSEAFFGCGQWVNYFLHSGHLHIEGLKMSKSLKNFTTIREALEKSTARQLRLMFLLQPWDRVMNFSFANLQEAVSREKSLKEFFQKVRFVIREQSDLVAATARWNPADLALRGELNKRQDEVDRCLKDNFDTSGAMNAIKELVTTTNKYIADNDNESRRSLLVKKVAVFVTRILRVFGVEQSGAEFGMTDNASDSQASAESVIAPVLDVLADFRVQVRSGAQKKVDHSELLKMCDALRDDVLPEHGIRLEDGVEQRWKYEDRETLMKEIAAKKAEAQARAKAKAQKTLDGLERTLNTWKKKAVDVDTAMAAQYGKDEAGEWSLDTKGEPLAKGKLKKAKKDLTALTKAHASYQAELTKDADFMTKLDEQTAAVRAVVNSA
eukprot:TRINITY_DN2486_c0_g1_i2.p1 TRINITY_DN2486_c0_g1~~TRINITY_DN2486_c0_g1_i2.p1  ORF type:complete len:747 (-),score=226.81 TRINITY_DN2486_c0_g1_i2:60-2300(-)